VLARRQTAGRGQYGRKWESPEGGLYVSLVSENVPAEWRERLALAAGLALVEAIGCAGLALRWPNDVMLKGKKVAGILCEAAAQGEKWAAVIGVGVNVERVELPPELRETATSLAAEGVRRERDALAWRIAAEWDRLMRERPGLSVIVGRVRGLVALHGRRVRVEDGGAWEGVAAGLDDEGRLLVQLEGGEVKALERGTVIEWGP